MSDRVIIKKNGVSIEMTEDEFAAMLKCVLFQNQNNDTWKAESVGNAVILEERK